MKSNEQSLQMTLAFRDISNELDRAWKLFPRPSASAHEAFAVLKEEVDELWEAVRLNQRYGERDEYIRTEAVQVAAMAIRLLAECVPLK